MMRYVKTPFLPRSVTTRFLLSAFFISIAFTPLSALSSDGKIEWIGPALRAPGLRQEILESKTAGAAVSYHIFLPPSYETERDRRFPVIFWLHGGGGGSEKAVAMGAGGGRGPVAVSRLYRSAMEDARMPETILVFPNGLRGGMWCDSKSGRTPVETILMKELLPTVDRRFRTIATREGRLVEGFSMGGFGAARLGFRYPEIFAGASLFGAGPMQEVFVPSIGPKHNAGLRGRVLKIVFGNDQDFFRAQSPRQIAAQRTADLQKNFAIRQVIGERDFTREANVEFSEYLHALEIPHHFEILEAIGHEPLRLLLGMGDDNWAFYREMFGPLSAGSAGDR